MLEAEIAVTPLSYLMTHGCSLINGTHFVRSSNYILFPVPLKISEGFTLGSPSANTMSCVVHCLLSIPDAPPQTQTVLLPVSEYVLPPVKVNGVFFSTLANCLGSISNRFYLVP